MHVDLMFNKLSNTLVQLDDIVDISVNLGGLDLCKNHRNIIGPYTKTSFRCSVDMEIAI